MGRRRDDDAIGHGNATTASHGSGASASYTQSWLDQLPNPNVGASRGWSPESAPVSHNRPWVPNHLPLPKRGNGATVPVPSPDLFVRDDPLSSGTDSCSETAPLEKPRECLCLHEKRRRTPSEVSLDTIKVGGDAFCRKSRRKTRPDRYDTHKSRKKHGTSVQKSSRPSRRRRAAEKQTLRSGKEVMENFVSASVPQERVTLKPNLSAGLFLNGRSSTPARQIADLEFYGVLPKGTRSKRRCETARCRTTRRTEKEFTDEANLFPSAVQTDAKIPASFETCSSRLTSAAGAAGSDRPHAFESRASRASSMSSADRRRARRRRNKTAEHDVSEPASLPRSPASKSAMSEAVRASASEGLIATGAYDYAKVPLPGIAKSNCFKGDEGQRRRTSDAPHVSSYVDVSMQTVNYDSKGTMVSPWLTSGRMPSPIPIRGASPGAAWLKSGRPTTRPEDVAQSRQAPGPIAQDGFTTLGNVNVDHAEKMPENRVSTDSDNALPPVQPECPHRWTPPGLPDYEWQYNGAAPWEDASFLGPQQHEQHGIQHTAKHVPRWHSVDSVDAEPVETIHEFIQRLEREMLEQEQDAQLVFPHGHSPREYRCPAHEMDDPYQDMYSMHEVEVPRPVYGRDAPSLQTRPPWQAEAEAGWQQLRSASSRDDDGLAGFWRPNFLR
ncbi:hypothetical protein CDD81_2157 [Ophiocordyceps australis]|uniref:Uncharacterized protein n=1 Tax=Ophiocordyceps australis TaxID=1399860 RepID=A0A2C5XZL7_9HYPO|nr:hypothetical protein CDD81_2157 [Ophiocordyceps australis]